MRAKLTKTCSTDRDNRITNKLVGTVKVTIFKIICKYTNQIQNICDSELSKFRAASSFFKICTLSARVNDVIFKAGFDGVY